MSADVLGYAYSMPYPHRLEEETVVCPICGNACIVEKCKVVCRSETCIYRIIYTCTEF